MMVKKELSLRSLLTIPKRMLVSSKSKLNKKLTIREMEETMNPHRINSIQDLRPDDYKGFSFSVTKLINMFKKRKG
jgi:predicted SPOUT superfamily RNA methylase MTH1